MILTYTISLSCGLCGCHQTGTLVVNYFPNKGKYWITDTDCIRPSGFYRAGDEFRVTFKKRFWYWQQARYESACRRLSVPTPVVQKELLDYEAVCKAARTVELPAGLPAHGWLGTPDHWDVSITSERSRRWDGGFGTE